MWTSIYFYFCFLNKFMPYYWNRACCVWLNYRGTQKKALGGSPLRFPPVGWPKLLISLEYFDFLPHTFLKTFFPMLTLCKKSSASVFLKLFIYVGYMPHKTCLIIIKLFTLPYSTKFKDICLVWPSTFPRYRNFSTSLSFSKFLPCSYLFDLSL